MEKNHYPLPVRGRLGDIFFEFEETFLKPVRGFCSFCPQHNAGLNLGCIHGGKIKLKQ